jgi:phosphoribosyl 1,2-cyclic phosphodiesterase/DNA-binding NarL/FixJ family response regulator
MKVYKVVLCDNCDKTLENIKSAFDKETSFEVHTASTCHECLELIDGIKPDIVFIPLLLPKIHGIEILKYIRSNHNMQNMGVVLWRGKPLFQDYEVVTHYGGNHYLAKTCSPEMAVDLAKRFVEGNLRMNTFEESTEVVSTEKPYSLIQNESEAYMKFWGTRGSIPVSGLDYYHYGGNTATLEVCSGDDLVIIDAGTGIRGLGNEIIKREGKKVNLFIGHTHWDHILGFPFFTPVYIPGYNIDIYASVGFGRSIEDIFTGMLDHDYFPVRLDEMQANFHFHDLGDGAPVKVGNIEIYYYYATHPGSTLCFKIKYGDKMIGYVTDNEFLSGYHGNPNDIPIDSPLLEPYLDFIEFLKDCDVLVHEAQYTPEDYLTKVGWGHSSITNALVLIKYTGVKEWIVTHHDPIHSDDDLEAKLILTKAIIKDTGINCRVSFAFDGMIVPL